MVFGNLRYLQRREYCFNMKKIPSLSILISAYNEEANIVNLLGDLIEQVESGYVLDTIMVLSDGSTDNTNRLVKNVKSEKIQLIEKKSRNGKAAGVNELFTRTESDIALVLDADIRIFDTQFISKIIDPIVNKDMDLVSALPLEMRGRTGVEKMLYASMMFKKRLYKSLRSGNSIYTCYGYARAFSKDLYKKIVISDSVGEDAYSYLYAKFNRYKYKSERNAIVYYKLPATLADHGKQSVRFFHSKKRFIAEFGEKFVSKQYSIPLNLFVSAFLHEAIANPALVLYVLVLFGMKIRSIFSPATKATWKIAGSSKIY